MVRAFLVTANVGSVYDDMELGLPIWLDGFVSVVRSRDPEFLAIHFQETGGKGTENVNETAEVFLRQLVARMAEIGLRVAEGFIDTRTELDDQYTALSSVYFVHESLRLPVHIWDFQDSKFYEVSPSTSSTSSTSSSSQLDPNIHIGKGLDQTNRKQKEKFPQHFYPNCKWSRKGFLRTRWRFGGRSGGAVVDLVNVHLFHDSCNLIAASAFPSPFAQLREKTLKYTLDRIANDGLERCPLFVFGDFNFRVNSNGVMEVLRKDFSDLPESEFVLGSKRFRCPELEQRFLRNYDWLRQFDFESKQFSGQLLEQDLNFPPTYPFEESLDEPEKYLRTRMPSWCDRVLFTPNTKDIISKDFPVEYNVIGSKNCMGDHKPVGLYFKIKTDEPATRPLSSALNSSSGPVHHPHDSIISPKVPTINGTCHSGKVPGRDQLMATMRRCSNCPLAPNNLLNNSTTASSGCAGANANGTCPNRLLMMNLTSVITQNNPIKQSNGLTSSNLSLIQLNSNSDLEKSSHQNNQGIINNCSSNNSNNSNSDKIPVSWSNYINNCTECDLIKNSNSNHHPKKTKSRTSGCCSACLGQQQQMSQSSHNSSFGSVTTVVPSFKCKCQQGKRKLKGGCVNCSKCVIL